MFGFILFLGLKIVVVSFFLRNVLMVFLMVMVVGVEIIFMFVVWRIFEELGLNWLVMIMLVFWFMMNCVVVIFVFFGCE